MTLTLYTFDWVPEFPRGFVRDLRVRWLLEEAGRPYRVDTVPLQPKSDAHRAMQPFAQVPVIRDGAMTLFESGAILLHLAEGTSLLPTERRDEVMQWLFAALNTVETATGSWVKMRLAQRYADAFGPPYPHETMEHAKQHMNGRLETIERLMSERDWIAGNFSVADIMMVDVLRLPEAEGALEPYPVLTSYIARATARPAFRKALADHLAHWHAADAARKVADPKEPVEPVTARED